MVIDPPARDASLPAPSGAAEDEHPYAERAFDLWRRRVPCSFSDSGYHDAHFCPCLACADGRAVLRRRPYIAEEFREWFVKDPDAW